MMKGMKLTAAAVIGAVAFGGVGTAQAAPAGDDEIKVSINVVPSAVLATIMKEAKGGTLQEIELEIVRGKHIYEAEITRGGKEIELIIAANGKLLGREVEGGHEDGKHDDDDEDEDDDDEDDEDDDDGDDDEDDDDEDDDDGKGKRKEWERSIKQSKVPARALAALRKLAGDARFREFAEEFEHGSLFYEGSWRGPSGRNVDALVTPAGDLVEIEEEISARQAPKRVIAAALKKAGDARITVEKKTLILYEVKFRKGNRRYEILLTPDGRRIEEEVEEGDHDDDDDDHDDDDDDDHDDDDDDDHDN